MRIRRLTLSLIVLILVSLLLASCSAAGEIASDASSVLQIKNTITVQGTASITMTPTIAYVNIGVATFNKEAAAAQSDNAVKMDNVYKALEDLGIGKDKIKTVTYNISPHYEYSSNATVMTGYDVVNGIQITVEDLAKVSSVLDMTVAQGVNQATAISFGITDKENNDTYLKALAEAVKSAKEKAAALASAAGLTIDKPLQIVEGTQQNVYPIYYGSNESVKAGDTATPISGGELKVTANVTLVYSY